MTIVSETDAAAYYDSQPKKRVATWVLIFDEKGRVLVVKPNYLERWLYPGGGTDANESPLTTAKRELKEELGIELTLLRPVYVNYLGPQPTGQNDMVTFAFITDPVMGDAFLESIQLQKDEIDEARFVSPNELQNYVGELRANPTLTYIQNQRNHEIIYMENGRLSTEL